MTDTMLLPCPFCGDDEPEITGERGWVWVACTTGTDCAGRGPDSEDEAAAIAAWNTRAAQPSAGAQGDVVGVDRDWMIKVIRERSLPQDAADMIIGAMRFAATPAQPDTGDAAALREALTPSGDTKAAYSGEFKFQVTQWRENEDPDSDDEMEEYLADFTVPWTTIKEIMAAISERAALSKPNAPGREG